MKKKTDFSKFFDSQLSFQPPAFRKDFENLSKKVGYQKAKQTFRARHHDIFD